MPRSSICAALPKSLHRYADRIAEYSDERHGNNNNGIWIYYKLGWKSYLDPMGCLHQDHEDTVKGLATCARYAIRCDCAECKPMHDLQKAVDKVKGAK